MSLREWWRRVLCERLGRHEPRIERLEETYCGYYYRRIEHNVGRRVWEATSGPQR